MINLKTTRILGPSIGFLLILLYFVLYKHMYPLLMAATANKAPLKIFFIDFAVGSILIIAGILFALDETILRRFNNIKVSFLKLIIYLAPAIYVYLARFNIKLLTIINFPVDYLDEITTLALFIIGIGIGKSLTYLQAD